VFLLFYELKRNEWRLPFWWLILNSRGTNHLSWRLSTQLLSLKLSCLHEIQRTCFRSYQHDQGQSHQTCPYFFYCLHSWQHLYDCLSYCHLECVLYCWCSESQLNNWRPKTHLRQSQSH
jgi:hypothetical protein